MKTIFIPLIATLIVSSGCSKTTDSSEAEDTSASGAAAALVGGSISNSNSGGTLSLNSKTNKSFLQKSFDFMPQALASTSCPTYASVAGCATNSHSMWLSYNSCSFGTSSATWTGIQSLIMSVGNASCGTFPNPGASATLTRQFVTASNGTVPSSATRTNSFGDRITIDEATANLSNFDGVAISTLANSGYGSQVTFNGSGARSSIVIGRRIVDTGLFDFSTTGTINISEASAASTTRTLSGSVRTYHNYLKVIATSTFNSVTHSNTCCLPVSGSITTVFTQGTGAPTSIGALIIGKSEQLVFTGCGTGNLTKTDGTTSAFALTNCF
jgi:hypothetical protein